MSPVRSNAAGIGSRCWRAGKKTVTANQTFKVPGTFNAVRLEGVEPS